MNPFVAANATRYARARPRYQGQVLETAARVLGIDRPVRWAVDVGCGTGHSSMALAALAGRVVAIDSARKMLEVAEASDEIGYLAAAAERLPVRTGAVDLVTAGAVFHWLDGSVFLEEARRVLRPEGALVCYSDFFTGRIMEAPGVQSWIHDSYVPRHPGPPRRPHLTGELASTHGFEVVGSPELETAFVMTVEEFADYLLTQSNALASVQSGLATEEELRCTILQSVKPLFPPSKVGTALFRARALCCRRLASREGRQDECDRVPS